MGLWRAVTCVPPGEGWTSQGLMGTRKSLGPNMRPATVVEASSPAGAQSREQLDHTHSRLSEALLWGWATRKPGSTGAAALATRLSSLQSTWLTMWTQVQINSEEMKTGSLLHMVQNSQLPCDVKNDEVI